MTRALVMSIIIAVLLLATVSLLNAANPPFTQCAPSGYNCNMLITLDSKGYLRVDTDPSLNYYPPTRFGIGSLIGFQNNSRATVYSLSLVATPGISETAANLCGPPGPPPVLNAPNVKIVNIPGGPLDTSDSVYRYYTLQPPYPKPWHFKCDVVFMGGVPKGGSTYFSIHNVDPRNPYFQVTTKTVIPQVAFKSAIVKGETATATVTLYPSPNPVPVTLNLVTTTGTGSAVFAATNSTTMTITAPGTVEVKGVEASTLSNNIELRLSMDGEV